VKRLVSLVITCGISVALLAWVFAEVDLNSALQHFRSANLWWLLVTLGAIFFSYIFRGVRWKYLLAKGDSLSETTLTHACSAGFLAIILLPLRAGEFVRPYLLSRKSDVSMSSGLASVFVERVIDIVAVLGLVLVSVAEIENVPPVVQTGVTAFSIIAIGAVCFVVSLVALRERGKKIFCFLLGFFSFLPQGLRDKLLGAYDDIVDGFSSVNSPRRAFAVLFSTIGLWSSIILVYQSLVVAFGLQSLSGLGVTIAALVALAIAAPSAPGFLGTFQFGCVLAMSELYGVDQSLSVAYSIVAHLIQMAFAVVAGMYSLKWLGFGFSDLFTSGDAGDSKGQGSHSSGQGENASDIAKADPLRNIHPSGETNFLGEPRAKKPARVAASR